MDNKIKKLSLLTAATTSLALSFGISSASPMPKTEDLDSLGESPGTSQRSDGLTAEVHQAQRSESGNLLSITWSIKNNKNERVVLTWLAGASYLYSGSNYAGVTISDRTGTTRFHPLMDGTGACLCSSDSSASFKERIEPGEQVAYWSLFTVPENVESISVEIPEFEPIENIPIS